MSDPLATASAMIDRAETLLSDVRKARVALAAAGELTGDAEAELAVYVTMLAAFERGLIAALEGVVADLKTLKGESAAEAWLRRRLEGLGDFCDDSRT